MHPPLEKSFLVDELLRCAATPHRQVKRGTETDHQNDGKIRAPILCFDAIKKGGEKKTGGFFFGVFF